MYPYHRNGSGSSVALCGGCTASNQGLLLVRFSAQCKHFLWGSLGGFSDKNDSLSREVDDCKTLHARPHFGGT